MLKKIKKISLKQIKVKEGNIIKYINKKSFYFKKFGEIYFSKIKKGHVKGWNLHKKTNCLITVPYGSVTFVLKDYKMKKQKTLTLKDTMPSLLVIPPNIWFKFWTKEKYSIIVNMIELTHNTKETMKKPIK
jgi:dTDP-4-dehydrorhamnose 3,5-epimerase